MSQTPFTATFSKSAESLIRNWTTTIPVVLVMAIILTMFYGLLVVQNKAETTLKNIQRKFSITVYLKDGADPLEIANFVNELEKRPDVVKPVVYTSKEQAWEIMSRTFSLDNDLLEKYKFSLPASLTITPRRLEDAKRIETFLNSQAKKLIATPLASQEKQKDVTDQMLAFIQNVRNATLRNLFFFTILFMIGGTLLISSAIHLAITSRHLEINIMKLVGASYAKITMPFIIEGLLLGILSFLLHLLLLLLLPFGTETAVYPNALLLEFIAIAVLTTTVSHLTTLFHIRKKTLV